MVQYRWRAAKINKFLLKFVFLRKLRREDFVKERERLLLAYCYHRRSQGGAKGAMAPQNF